VDDVHSTNNTAEYKALLLALRKMKALGQQTFIIKTDSKVIQVERYFKGCLVHHIPRNDNNEANKLAKAAAQNLAMPPDVFFKIIREPSIKDPNPKTMNIVETRNWRAVIMAYLRGQYEPQDKLEEKRLRQRA
jgi:hypothetical protein